MLESEPRNPAVLSTAELERLAVAAGFKVFNGKIVACDEGISGLATESLKRFAELVEGEESERWQTVGYGIIGSFGHGRKKWVAKLTDMLRSNALK